MVGRTERCESTADENKYVLQPCPQVFATVLGNVFFRGFVFLKLSLKLHKFKTNPFFLGAKVFDHHGLVKPCFMPIPPCFVTPKFQSPRRTSFSQKWSDYKIWKNFQPMRANQNYWRAMRITIARQLPLTKLTVVLLIRITALLECEVRALVFWTSRQRDRVWTSRCNSEDWMKSGAWRIDQKFSAAFA